MLELFALPLLDYIKGCVTLSEGEALQLSNDSQNAIVYSSADTYAYYLVSVDIATNQFILHEVILNKSLDVKSDVTYSVSTVNEAITHIIEFVIKY